MFKLHPAASRVGRGFLLPYHLARARVVRQVMTKICHDLSYYHLARAANQHQEPLGKKLPQPSPARAWRLYLTKNCQIATPTPPSPAHSQLGDILGDSDGGKSP